MVDQVVRLVDGAEYKRRQMPPGVRITTKAFGKDRRMPITNRYRSRVAPTGVADTSGPRDSPEGPVADPAPVGRAGSLRQLSDLVPPPVGRSGRLPVAESVSGVSPLALDDTAALVGEYRWIEHSLYRLLGEWVVDMPIAAVQVHLDALSMRHAWHAELWAERLPVRTGIDPDAWTVPSGPTTALFAALSGVAPPRQAPGSPGRWPTRTSSGHPGPCPAWRLYRVVLPRLVTSYDATSGSSPR